jgi:UTP--glucose-1-phosphate uridylyltransferase
MPQTPAPCKPGHGSVGTGLHDRGAFASVALVKATKAVITAAGKNQRSLPLQTLVDRDGASKSALAILAEEITHAGISEIAVVVCPGDEAAYAKAVGPLARSMCFIPQNEPLGYGHAVHCAADFTGGDPFLLMVGDHLYTSRTAESCTAQLLATAESAKCAVSAVQATHESKLPYYGCIGGRRVQGAERLYEVETVIEKPTPTEAEQRLVVPGLRAGNYLCFFGMHVLTASVMQTLARQIAEGPSDLSAALAVIAQRERYLACEVQGRRHDLDLHYGLLTTQLALALAGKDRDAVLSLLVDQLAQS